jgi:hypothetical protein
VRELLSIALGAGLAPLLVALGVTLRLARTDALGRGAGALGLAAGAALGQVVLCVGLLSGVGWPPTLDGRVPLLVLAAGVLALARRSPWLDAARVATALLVGLAMLGPRFESWPRGAALGAALALAGAIVVAGGLHDAVVARRGGGVVGLLWCAGAALAVLEGGSFKLALLAVAVGAALAGVLGARLLHRSPLTEGVERVAPGIVPAALGAVVARNVIYGEQTLASALLLCAAPALLAWSPARLGRAAAPLGWAAFLGALALARAVAVTSSAGPY